MKAIYVLIIFVISIISLLVIYRFLRPLNTDFAFRFRVAHGYVTCNNTLDCNTCWCNEPRIKIDTVFICPKFPLKTPCRDLSVYEKEAKCNIHKDFYIIVTIDGKSHKKRLWIPCVYYGGVVYKFSEFLEKGEHTLKLELYVDNVKMDETFKTFRVTW